MEQLYIIHARILLIRQRGLVTNKLGREKGVIEEAEKIPADHYHLPVI
ncbi:MAG: hypothetical protein AAF600_21620 [Bacteroidota bacterium]